MSKAHRFTFNFGAICICAGSLLYNGCASRVALKDDMGQPISQNEIRAKKNNKKFLLYTVGGGALSFGASFFLGAMINRSLDEDSSAGSNRTALWVITTAGTAAGTALFAHTGRVRDFNQAVEVVKDERQKKVDQKILTEKQRQEALAAERKRMEDERKLQEVEREKLLQRIRDKQSKENKPE